MHPTTFRRLAFAKYLHGLAIEQSRAPEPMASASLLTLHDAVEIFLQLASEHLDANASKARSFMEYWPAISACLPDGVELPQRESMRRLNTARVALKHHGTHPARSDLEAHRATATAFLAESCPIVFAAEFASVSMVDLVLPETSRGKLRDASAHLAQNEYREALTATALSLHEMLDDYESRKRSHFGRSPFFFGERMWPHSSFHLGIDRVGAEARIADFVDAVQKSVMAMQQALKILALGLDYKRYTRFQLHTPHLQPTAGSVHVSWGARTVESTSEDVQFCIEFVIDASIRLQEFDYEVPPRPHPRPAQVETGS